MPRQRAYADVAEDAQGPCRRGRRADDLERGVDERDEIPIERLLVVAPMGGHNNGPPAELGKVLAQESRAVHSGQVAWREVRRDEGDRAIRHCGAARAHASRARSTASRNWPRSVSQLYRF